MSLKNHGVFHFGEFSLDPVAKVLFRAGEPVALTRKAAETLLVLVEQAGQVMTKEEIRAAVWADRVVDDANLAQNIAVIRKALGVEKGSPAYIETFAGRGYRLQGPVVSAPVASASVAPVGRVSWWPWVGVAVAGALGWAIWPKAAEVVPQITAVSRLPGTEYQPAISPDGMRTAFLWHKEGGEGAQIWTGEGQVATGAGVPSSPTWSGDGRSLAFLRVAGGWAEVVAGEGKVAGRVKAKEVEAESRMLAWSPDGGRFVVSGAEGLVVLEGGGQRLLTSGGEDVAPRISPDGKRVAFLRVLNRLAQEVFVVDLASGAARQLTRGGGQISDVDWSRDGRSVLAAMKRESEFRIWRLPVDGGAEQALGIYGDSPIQFSAARGSDRLVYAQLRQDRNIWRLDLGERRWARVVASTAQDASPQYSPDGRWICFRSDRSGAEQLWVSRVDGSEAKAVTGVGVNPSVGRWAPDSRTIVFNNPQTREVSVTNREDGVVRALGWQGVHPVYSPDGKWIYAGGTERLVRVAVGGGAAETVVASPGVSLAVSADGKGLYFVREPKEGALWRAELGTGKYEKVMDGLVPGCTSCWALAGEGIYYLGGAAQQALYFREWATGKVRMVMGYPEFLWPLGSGPFSLSGDGKSLLTVRVDASPGDVFLAAPFR